MSKKIIKIIKLPYEKELVLDAKAPQYLQEPFGVYAKSCIDNRIAYKSIKIINCKTLPADVVSLITPAYLTGTTIVINDKSFTNPNPKYRYGYQWIDFDRTQIPNKLANFKVGQSTFLAELQKVRSNYLPNNLWTAIDDYSQERIAKCIEYNKFDFSCAEHWYKELMSMNSKLFHVYSPNEKTWFEYNAEKLFEQSLQDVQLKPGLRALDDSEIAFLKQYANAYGIEIPEFQWRYDYRKTNHGYTKEPVRVTGGMSASDLSRCFIDYRNKDKQVSAPRSVREDFMLKSYDNAKLLRDAYEQLIYIMRLKDDSFLMPGYKRCPICHKIYRESEGCEGHIEPITFINANNLFYGIGSEFHDIDAEQDYLDQQEDELAELNILEGLID